MEWLQKIELRNKFIGGLYRSSISCRQTEGKLVKMVLSCYDSDAEWITTEINVEENNGEENWRRDG